MGEISGVASLIEGELAQHVALPLYKTGYLTTFPVAKDVPALNDEFLKKPRVANRARVTFWSVDANVPRGENAESETAGNVAPLKFPPAALVSAFPLGIAQTKKRRIGIGEMPIRLVVQFAFFV